MYYKYEQWLLGLPTHKRKIHSQTIKKRAPKKSVRMMKRNLCWIFREINKLIDEAVEEEDEAVEEEDKSVLARVGKFYSFLPFSFFY